MIRISQLKMPLGHTENALLLKAAKELYIQPELIKETKLVKQSVDARKKPEIHYSYIAVSYTHLDVYKRQYLHGSVYKNKSSRLCGGV